MRVKNPEMCSLNCASWAGLDQYSRILTDITLMVANIVIISHSVLRSRCTGTYTSLTRALKQNIMTNVHITLGRGD